ncbi:hypothetical protein EIP91_010768 [Steccherinum ochraceum]|uniref:Telomerase Cajal body protein 1 n=1 Tax=Steccherinum ochraceum TaxID=92696 RepID=A0A4R0R2S7_9APHY|nr:hypothetical protein EIP91_010768 [Steccherinum ochraceum]
MPLLARLALAAVTRPSDDVYVQYQAPPYPPPGYVQAGPAQPVYAGPQYAASAPVLVQPRLTASYVKVVRVAASSLFVSSPKLSKSPLLQYYCSLQHGVVEAQIAMADEAAYTWTPPAYNVSKAPRCVFSSPFPEVQADSKSHDFARSARWCPDGLSALAQCESGYLQFLNLPRELVDVTLNCPQVPPSTTPQMSRLHLGAPIVDFAWYPSATCRDPASFCFVVSVRECPVKLIDASDGRLRASYKIVDHRERQIAPHSLAFNPSTSKLYCGFEDAIEVFDLHRPGEGQRLHTTPSKRSKDGLKGIISSLAFASEISSGVYAAGSLNPSPVTSSNVALFSESTGETPLMFVGDERDSGFGVMFNPVRPYSLFASFRRHSFLYCWDIRGDVSVPVQKLALPPATESDGHHGATNQRLRFDIDFGGKLLGVGDHGGHISLFDLDSYEHSDQPISGATIVSSPILQYDAHDDAVGSVGFHPLRSLLLSVSGSRHFSEGSDLDASELSEHDEDEVLDQHGGEQAMSAVKDHTITRDPPCPSVEIWEF